MNPDPFRKQLEALTLDEAATRARRIHAHDPTPTRKSVLPVRVLAVTPCGDAAPTVEVVAESSEFVDAIANAAARIYARARFDDVRALVVIAEAFASSEPDDPSPRDVVVAVGVTLGPCPSFTFGMVNARTLEPLEAGASAGTTSPLVAMLEQVALSADILRGARRSLGIDTQG